MRSKLQKQSALKLAGRNNETHILSLCGMSHHCKNPSAISSGIPQMKRRDICKLNYPAVGGGYRKYPWYPASVTNRDQ